MEKEAVGIRELRRGLSRFVKRAEEGETIQISHHGRPVAQLAPLTAEDDPVARLVAEGKLIPARRGPRKLGPPPACSPSLSVSEALEEQRSED